MSTSGQLKRIGAPVLIGLLSIGGLSACEPKSTEPPPTVPPTVDAPLPPPPPRGSFLAQLAPEQTAQLEQLGVEIVVPGVVPPGFDVAAIAAEASRYVIAYRNSQNRCFAIEFTQNPPELPETTQTAPIAPPLFPSEGYALNYEPPVDSPSRLFSDWLPGGQGAYRLAGASEIQDLQQSLATCQNVAPETAIQVLDSLTVISSDIVGDGETP